MKRRIDDDPLRDPETYAILGAAMEVHRVLGPGFVESVYEDALSYEFGARGVEFERQVALPVQYKGHLLAPVFRADYICFGRVIVELKASSSLGPADDAQVLNYLKATTAARGLLVNFGEPRLRYRRFVNGWIPDHSQAEDGETGHLRASATSAVA